MGISVPPGAELPPGRPVLPGALGRLGLVVLVPEGRGISGIGTTVGRELEEVPGLVVVVVVLPMLRQPAKRVAVKTQISVIMHAFFMI